MKTSYFLNFVLAAALLYVGVLYIEKSGAEPENASATGNCGVEMIMTRTSVRSYDSTRTVSAEQVDTLMRAAMAAPTAMNKQPWQFVVIDDRTVLDTIAARFPNISMAAGASVAVAVCGDMSLAIEGDGQPYWIQDCSAATENLLLAAHAMGLGAVWCGIYPIEERVKDMSSLLKLPENVIPLALVPVGYPSGNPQPKDKFNAGRVHENQF